jgi:Uncharacterized protein conserved in bacteria (DUF2200)
MGCLSSWPDHRDGLRVRVQDVEDPLMQPIRYLDKLVDELAKGKAMHKILRGEPDRAAAREPTG